MAFIQNRLNAFNHSNEKRPCRAYNIATKELIGKFESLEEASTFTGVTRATILSSIKKKTKNRTNKLGMVLAFR